MKPIFFSIKSIKGLLFLITVMGSTYAGHKKSLSNEKAEWVVVT